MLVNFIKIYSSTQNASDLIAQNNFVIGNAAISWEFVKFRNYLYEGNFIHFLLL